MNKHESDQLSPSMMVVYIDIDINKSMAKCFEERKQYKKG